MTVAPWPGCAVDDDGNATDERAICFDCCHYMGDMVEELCYCQNSNHSTIQRIRGASGITGRL